MKHSDLNSDLSSIKNSDSDEKSELDIIKKLELYQRYKVDERHLVPLYTSLWLIVDCLERLQRLHSARGCVEQL